MLAALALSVIRVRQAHYNLDSRKRDSVFVWSWALVESNQQDVEAELEAEGLAYGAQLGFGRGHSRGPGADFGGMCCRMYTILQGLKPHNFKFRLSITWVLLSRRDLGCSRVLCSP